MARLSISPTRCREGLTTRKRSPRLRSPRSLVTLAARSPTKATKGMLRPLREERHPADNSVKAIKNATPRSPRYERRSSVSLHISSRGEYFIPTTAVHISPTRTRMWRPERCSSSQSLIVLNNSHDSNHGSDARVPERLCADIQQVRSTCGCVWQAWPSVCYAHPGRLRGAVARVAVVTAARLVRDGNGWRLPLAGCAVVQCCVDWALTLRLEHPSGTFEVRIEQPFTFTSATGSEVLLVPENDPTGLGPVLACSRTAVEEAAASDDGELAMSFADGSSIRIRSSPDHEAWGLTGPAGLRVVSVPGGELAIWQPDQAAGSP